MFKLKIAYNNKCENIVKKLDKLIKDKYKLIDLESYNEDYYKEKSKAYKLKYGYSARMTPFAIFTDGEFVIPFYSEDNKCNLENILKAIKYYESTSN